VNGIQSQTLEEFGFTDTQPQLNVQESEYLRLLGYPRNHEIGERTRELISWARNWFAENGRPWIFARAAGGVKLDTRKIVLSGAEFISDRLHEQFSAAEAHDAILVAVSAGKQCEEKAHQCWQEGKPDEYFFLEMYGSAVVEHLVTLTAGRICGWADQNAMAVLPHYSPGYTGWPVSDQSKLWKIIRGNNGSPIPADLEVMETGMLRPKKSLLTVFGLTRYPEKVQPGSKLVPCENCSLPSCQYRRAPYRLFMPQSEIVGHAQIDGVELDSPSAPVLDKLARYTVNPRALKKWSQERLHLETASDGSIKAQFRFEGTTCSNLGRLIEYDYHVRLKPRAQFYWVAEARCTPADGDTGHVHQCEYLRDPEFFMSQIAAEKPFVGCPLNDVLAWKRSVNPAGCNCEAASREHKWGMVFEVIHFALAQRGAS
jgi:hypothetical protein